MDYNKPWGWAPSRAAGPMSNTMAPLASSAATAPSHTVLPEDPAETAMRSAGSAVANKALDNFMKPGEGTTSVAQDSATKAALYGDVGYGAPLGAEAATAGAEAATEVAADAGAELATEGAGEAAAAAGEAALGGASSFIPYAGVMKSLAEGEYAQAAAEAAATSMLGPLAGKAAKYATKWIGLAEGTANVAAPMSGTDRAAARAAAGARFSPELFGVVNAPTAAIPATPTPAQALSGGKGVAGAPGGSLAAGHAAMGRLTSQLFNGPSGSVVAPRVNIPSKVPRTQQIMLAQRANR
jgi:hypothetical protein